MHLHEVMLYSNVSGAKSPMLKFNLNRQPYVEVACGRQQPPPGSVDKAATIEVRTRVWLSTTKVRLAISQLPREPTFRSLGYATPTRDYAILPVLPVGRSYWPMLAMLSLPHTGYAHAILCWCFILAYSDSSTVYTFSFPYPLVIVSKTQWNPWRNKLHWARWTLGYEWLWVHSQYWRRCKL